MSKKDKKKDDEMKKEIERLNSVYVDLDGKKKKVAEGLIGEAAFMRCTLSQLKTMIDESGPIDEMSQGDYTILREHPAMKAYNTMIQRYTTVIKQLSDMLPREMPKDEDDGFDSFVNDRD